MAALHTTMNMLSPVKPPTDSDRKTAQNHASPRKMELLVQLIEDDLGDPRATGHIRFEEIANTRYKHAKFYNLAGAEHIAEIERARCSRCLGSENGLSFWLAMNNCSCEYWRNIARNHQSLINPDYDDKVQHRRKYQHYKAEAEKITSRLYKNMRLLEWARWVSQRNEKMRKAPRVVETREDPLEQFAKRKLQALKNAAKMKEMKARSPKTW